MNTADSTAVAALFERVTTAWDAADPAAYADLFTEDADYVTFIGTHLHGRKQILDSHAALWEKYQKNTRLYGKILRMRFITADVAVIVTEGAILRPGRREPKRSGIKVQTLTAVRRDGRWLFAAFQNTKHRRFMERFAAKQDRRIAPEAR